MKIYYVAGEPSGDTLAAWHVERCRQATEIRGVGGAALEAAGGTLDIHIDALSCAGGIELLTKLWRLYRIQQQIVATVIAWQPDEIVLVNFSSFNLSLAKKLKAAGCAARITFFSPPQLWIWGAWRARKLAARVDQIEVIFPHEVAWYRERGITVTYVGSPIFDRVAELPLTLQHAQAVICLPGSRAQERTTLLPIFLRTLEKFHAVYPEVPLALFCASTAARAEIAAVAQDYALGSVAYVVDGAEQHAWMQRATVALTKPGTNTLELALCGIPAVVAYKVSWITYLLARMVTNIPWTALPNILFHQEIYPEYIQQHCRVEILSEALHTAYRDALQQGPRALRVYNAAHELRRQFEQSMPRTHLSKMRNTDRITEEVNV